MYDMQVSVRFLYTLRYGRTVGKNMIYAHADADRVELSSRWYDEDCDMRIVQNATGDRAGSPGA